MLAENLFHIGKLAKLHGVNGEVLLIADNIFPKKISSTEWVFLLIDGLPVPFYISHLEASDEKSAIIKFADIETAGEMEEYVGVEVMIEKSDKSKPLKNPPISGNVQGYQVIDLHYGNIGYAGTLFNYSGNNVLQILMGEKELLIPLNETTIVKIDKKSKIISVNCPDGLINLYL